MRGHINQALLAGLAVSLGGIDSTDSSRRPMNVNSEPEDDSVPIAVTREVFNEVLTLHTLEQVNAMPRAARHEVINAARERIRLRHRTDNSETAAAIRADRERRKAEAFAKRQPK